MSELRVKRSKLRIWLSIRPREEVGRERLLSLGSDSAWILWLDEKRAPLLETRRLILLSLGSPEVVGLLLDAIALFDALPWRDVEACTRSGSAWWLYNQPIAYVNNETEARQLFFGNVTKIKYTSHLRNQEKIKSTVFVFVCFCGVVGGVK